MTSPTGSPPDPCLPRPRRSHRRLQRWWGRATTTVTLTTAGGVLLLGAPVATSGAPSAAPVADAGLSLAAADAHRWPGHPGRKVIRYTVRPGDTATGLAVRFHAWTRELPPLNRLGRHGTLYVGQRIRIPVVVAAARTAQHHHTKPKPKTKHIK